MTAALTSTERVWWRGYHTSLHVPDTAVLGTEERRRGSGYHTSIPLHLPDKKAKIEMAVDTLKEKKKAPKVSSHRITLGLRIEIIAKH